MAGDFILSLTQRVAQAAARRTALRIRGGGSKDFYGGVSRGDLLDVAEYSGIVAYEPKELVLTVRAGTPVAQVEAELAKQRQMLAFEPPHFSPTATIGGAVAAGLSGPRRPYAGSLRDFVLGTRIVNGKGEDLSFGGRVIKNVAGYDVSRLMAGALGTLGIITEVSFKVLPLPAAQATLAFELDQGAAIVQANQWAVLRVRLSGAEPAVQAASTRLGGEDVAEGETYWRDLREHRLSFFGGGAPLWRLSLPQNAEPIELAHPQLVEWGGGVRWVSAPLDSLGIRSTTERVGGHATLFRGGDKSTGAFHPLKPAVLKIHRRLKQAFDPAGILNPGRMYDF
jgi:glycolate oxidase FAD binding subunit